MSVTPELDFLGRLEHELMEGKAKWIAEFSESFRNVNIQGADFDMLVEGSTRGKSGYMFSALLSQTMLPAYAASCFVKILPRDQALSRFDLNKYLTVIKSYVKDRDAKWSFLVFVSSGRPIGSLQEQIEALHDETIGVALVNIATMDITHNSSFIGKSTARIIPRKWSPIDMKMAPATALPSVPSRMLGRQWGKLALVFGVSLVGLTVLSFLLAAFLTGRLATSQVGLLINLGLASAITYSYSKGKYYNQVSLDKEGISVQIGRNKPNFGKWSDFDLVSLKQTGAGQFDVRLYKKNDHADFFSVPASGVKANPSGFRWRAMELCRHGLNRYVRI